MQVDAVKEAKADHEKGWAWAKYDSTKATPERLVEAVNQHTPFRATLKAPDPPSTPAPDYVKDFTLPDLDGRPVKLSDWKGSVILLDFWATWCAPCLAEIPVLNRLHEKYASRGLKVIGVAVQSGWAQDIRPHVAKNKISYTVLAGNDDIMEQYRVIGFPMTFLIDGNGKIHKKYVGTPPDKEAGKAADMEREIEMLLQAK